MMKKIFVVLAFLTFWPAAAFAASFTATVDSTSAAVGQPVTLQLTLSGASAKDAPDTSVLTPSFNVVSQGQTTNMSYVNGQMSSSVGWQFVLLPKKAGTIVIPPVSVAKDGGVLKTERIMLDVSSASAAPPVASGQNNAYGGASPSANAGEQVYVRTSVDSDHPYQNQPVTYTVRLTSPVSMTDISLQPPTASNAIVKPIAKPLITKTVENGMQVNAVAFRFLVTPVQAGKITIQPAVLQGDVEVPNQAPQNGGFGNFGNFFTNPFQMMQNNMAGFGFNSYQPFTVAGDSVTLHVRPPVAGVTPWLPLASLRLSQHFDMTAPVHVGDPVTRKIVLLAGGMTGGQLPSLKDQQNSADFSVYAGKPETGKHINSATGAVSGWLRESYSLIPQKAGKLVIPAVTVKWWNTQEDKVVVSTLPEKTIDVLPAAAGTGQGANQTAFAAPAASAGSSASAPLKAAAVGVPARGLSGPPWLYAFMAVMVVIVLCALFWALSLQRKINRLVAVREPVAEKKEAVAPKKEPAGFAGADKAATAEDLKNYLQAYAHDHWGTPANAPLEKVFAAATGQRPALGGAEAQSLVRDLAGAVYAGKAADLEDLKKRCKLVLQAAKGKAADNDDKAGGEKLSGLNPS